MAEYKYIMVEATVFQKGEPQQIQFPIIFGHLISHKDMAESLRGMFYRTQFRMRDIKIASAGFCHLEVASTHGKSETLNMESRPNDKEIANSFRMSWGWDFGR